MPAYEVDTHQGRVRSPEPPPRGFDANNPPTVHPVREGEWACGPLHIFKGLEVEGLAFPAIRFSPPVGEKVPKYSAPDWPTTPLRHPFAGFVGGNREITLPDGRAVRVYIAQQVAPLGLDVATLVARHLQGDWGQFGSVDRAPTVADNLLPLTPILGRELRNRVVHEGRWPGSILSRWEAPDGKRLESVAGVGLVVKQVRPPTLVDVWSYWSDCGPTWPLVVCLESQRSELGLW